MSSNYFILDDTNRLIPTTRQELLDYLRTPVGRKKRVLAFSKVNHKKIRTTFTGTYFGGSAEPKVFKTNVYNNEGIIIATYFYTSYDCARAGHVELLKKEREYWKR